MSEMTNPYIFPECEGCQDHRYSYQNTTMHVVTDVGNDGNEIITDVKVEPETHYCSPEPGYFHKLRPDHRPYSCIKAPKSEKQEETRMANNDPDVVAVDTGALASQRDLAVITAELQFYKARAGEDILAIGKRLNEAKEQLEHGEWLDWLRDEVEFSDATAQRFMRLAREYTDSSPVLEMGSTKALILLALPPAEREAFVEETHEVKGEEKAVTDMSKRELEAAVRERAEALEQKAAAEAAAENARQVAEKAEADLAAADQRAADAKAEAKRLEDEKAALSDALEQLKKVEPVPAEEPDQQSLDAFRKEAAKEAKKAAEEKLKKKLADADAAKSKAEQDVSAAQAERDRIQKAAESEKAVADEKIAALEKKLAVASSETVTIFKTQFENAQGPVNAMLGCLKKLEGEPDTHAKLTAALRALCEKTLAKLTTE